MCKHSSCVDLVAFELFAFHPSSRRDRQQPRVGYYRQISKDSTIQKSSQDLVNFFSFELCVNGRWSISLVPLIRWLIHVIGGRYWSLIVIGRLSMSLVPLIWWFIHVIGGRYWSSTAHSFAYTSFSSNFQCLPFLDSLSLAMAFVPISWCFLIHGFIRWDDFVICAKQLGFIMKQKFLLALIAP